MTNKDTHIHLRLEIEGNKIKTHYHVGESIHNATVPLTAETLMSFSKVLDFCAHLLTRTSEEQTDGQDGD